MGGRGMQLLTPAWHRPLSAALGSLQLCPAVYSTHTTHLQAHDACSSWGDEGLRYLEHTATTATPLLPGLATIQVVDALRNIPGVAGTQEGTHRQPESVLACTVSLHS